MISSSKKVIVIYKTKYGSSKQYAEWIAEEVNADLYKCSDVSIEDLQKYKTIVYGGSLYACGILGVKLLTNNFEMLKDKKIIVFSVGAAAPKEKAYNDVKNNNFTADMLNNMNFFMLRGGFNYQKLNLVDKFLMNLMKLKIKSKKEEEIDEESRELLKSFDNPVSFVNKKALTPVIECIKNN
ncbi:flavodoxin domain-containing protein [Abyssisolibacter fermentans]|uniref:flavodoxin domain-containing protein n=1 Tax=Abyssisolibacter fermentans TaxID=1766203 RepID=UPI00082A9971|nr:flavodoxin domain-containing protein [Abyssisolibacter fermentans]